MSVTLDLTPRESIMSTPTKAALIGVALNIIGIVGLAYCNTYSCAHWWHKGFAVSTLCGSSLIIIGIIARFWPSRSLPLAFPD